MSHESHIRAWDQSYARRENHVFAPSEEVVRFVARNLRRRVGLDEFVDVVPDAEGMRVLDVGCGIGRHLVFGEDMGLRMYGVDLSPEAVRLAGEWLQRRGVEDFEQRTVVGDVRSLPWPDSYFDHALSDGVFDSMSFDLARAGVAEVWRVLKPGSLFYCSLISGDQTGLEPNFAGERIVGDVHERGTVQSHFNQDKIASMVSGRFSTVSLELVTHDDVIQGRHHGRWHAVMRRT